MNYKKEIEELLELQKKAKLPPQFKPIARPTAESMYIDKAFKLAPQLARAFLALAETAIFVADDIGIRDEDVQKFWDEAKEEKDK